MQELTYSTGSESAEIQSSGIRVNSVPKDGGNKFSGSFFVYGQGSSLQSDNRSDAMKAIQANGLPLISIAGTAYDYQVNPAFGGPIVKDKLWFYATYKYEDDKFYVPSSHFSDGSPAFRNSMGNYSGVGRFTWAASSKDKIRGYVEKQFNGEFYNGFNTYAVTTPAASTDAFGRGWISQLRWTRAQSNKLLFEAGVSTYNLPYEQDLPRVGRCLPGDLPSLNASTGLVSGGVRLPDSAVFEHDTELQHAGVGELHHRVARDQGGHDRRLGHELAHVRAERQHQHAGPEGQRPPALETAPESRSRSRSATRRRRRSRTSTAISAASSRTPGRCSG